jgi:DNA polymerase
VYGQIFLIDLIEKIEDLVQIINSNTDGIFFKMKKKDIPELERRVKEFEERTRLSMEFDAYVKYIGKDVNNYIAVAENGELHAKGSYVKDLDEMDYDLPIVNEALRNYMVLGTAVEITINACTDLRKFQKLVKLSNNYEWVEWEQGWNPWYGKRGKENIRFDKSTKFENKAYRVFASKDKDDGRIRACKWEDGKLKKDKFALTSIHVFIDNGDIRNKPIPDKLDRDWYIKLAKKRLKDYGF